MNPVTTTCKSCRLFDAVRMIYPKHYEAGIGRCTLEPRSYVFRSRESTCERYSMTDTRRAALAAMVELNLSPPPP